MNSFPLVRIKWSNEHVMTALFIVLVLYLVPGWIQGRSSVISFLAVLTLGLLIDGVANFIHYKRPMCSVSAAVTGAMLEVLTPGVPLWGKLLGISFALLAGKHLWGGTGKNPVNPAITGLLFTSIMFGMEFPTFVFSLMMLPAVILSLPFLMFRPLAGVGFIAGMTVFLFASHGLSVAGIITYGVIFWGCLVLTDPVTVTPHPVIGTLAGFICGFLPLWISETALAAAIGVVAVNIVSAAADRILTSSQIRMSTLKFDRIIPFAKDKIAITDFIHAGETDNEDVSNISRDEVLRRIEKNEVYGFGGAAFPTYKKIKTLIESGASEKHLIINGVECDPGLIHDKWIMNKYPDEIFKGIEILKKCSEFKSVTIAVKDTKGLSEMDGCTVFKARDYYPAGAEKALIKNVLGKELSHDTIPAAEGILVLNVQTVFSIYEAVCQNKKSDYRFITVADVREKTGQVVKVKLGSRVRDVIENTYPNKGLTFTGGGLMQSRIADDDTIVDKSVNFIAAGDLPRYKESPFCSKCGLCAINCPSGLKVNNIADLVDDNKLQETAKFQVERCISCGLCSYLCLAGRNLSSRMKIAKEYSINYKG